MNPDLIRSWLKLPPGPWPPDHYQLLGLAPGEADPGVIERHVQERMDLVRRYQVRHPEPTTEAMNRIAQAFVSLSDPAFKKTYDRTLNLTPPEPEPPPPPAAPEESAAAPDEPPTAEAPAETLDPLGWLTTADALRTVEVPPALAPTEIAASPGMAPPPVRKPPPEPAASPVTPEPAPAPRPTTRDLYRALARTRRVERFWTLAGKSLGSPKRRVPRQAEARELVAALAGLREHRADLPPDVGEAGQPGYFVLTLAAQANLVPTFLTLTGGQRKKLSTDWAQTAARLAEVHEELRDQVRKLRRRTPLGRWLRRVPGLLVEKSTLVLVLVGLLALNIILWRSALATLRGEP